MTYSDPLHSYRRDYTAGEIIAEQGDPANVFFILIRGSVSVHHGMTHLATIEEPGAYFGEMAALLGHSRTATLRAEWNTACYALPINGLAGLIESQPDIALKLARTLAERLDAANRRIDRLALSTTE